MAAPTNSTIADMLDRIADLLDAKGENPFRVRSYRTAAHSIRESEHNIAKLVASKGTDGLGGIKGVGEKLSGLIQEFIEKGEVELLQTLEKEAPQQAVKARPKTDAKHEFKNPIDIPVELVLTIDEEYRTRAASGKLKKIAPKKLNPTGEAWLPVFTTALKGYKFTVMFSNTERAHELGKTDDWVVVYYQKEAGENQCTVVTEQRGAMKGKRIVRGREAECLEYHTRNKQ